MYAMFKTCFSTFFIDMLTHLFPMLQSLHHGNIIKQKRFFNISMGYRNLGTNGWSLNKILFLITVANGGN